MFFLVQQRKKKKGSFGLKYECAMTSEPKSTKDRIASLLSISHDKDVDGIASSAIVWRYAKSKTLEYDVELTDYGSFEQVFSSVSSRRNTLIVITDLGMDETTVELAQTGLSRAIQQGCRVVWLDHHQWSPRAVKSILSLGNKPILRINHNYCAAEIAYKVLMPRDKICEELASIAHDTDFNLRQIDAAIALTDAVSISRFNSIARKEDVTEALLPLLKSLAEDGIAGVWNDSTKRFRNELLDRQVHQYRKERLKRMRKALSGHCDQRIHGKLVRVVEIPSGVTTTDIGTYLTDAENLQIQGQNLEVADLLITISQGGLLGIRRGSNSILCDAAAKLFSGGGHVYAAGGEYGLYDDFEAACDDIFLMLSKSQDWIVN
ncbi:MAG: hypothetical protein EAX81_00510 [Candidatus Thorarchaeota archaeon]|nr:hypothetical protein [Candidatus Thorarchaeota archaeon]